MINTNRINELKDEVGEDDLEEVIVLFCEEVEEVLEALDTTPPDQMAAQLHFLKGSALNIGLEAVSNLCRNAELSLKSDPSSAIDVDAIKSTYDQSKIALLAQ